MHLDTHTSVQVPLFTPKVNNAVHDAATVMIIYYDYLFCTCPISYYVPTICYLKKK